MLMRALRDSPDLKQLSELRKQTDPAEWLKMSLDVTFPDESEVMLVSLSGESPEGLDKLVNAVVQAYFDEIVFAERNQKLERLNSLELAHKKAESELRVKRTELKQLVERVGSGDSMALTIVQQNSLNQFAQFQQQYAKVQFELMQAEGELDAADKALETKIPLSDRQLNLVLRTDPIAVQIIAEKQLVLDQLQVRQERAKNGVADPQQEESKRRLAVYDEKYHDRRESLRQELIEDKRDAAAVAINSLKRKIQLLTVQEARLGNKSRELEAAAKQIGRSSIDVEMMRTEIAAVQDVVQRLGNELGRTRVEMQPDSRSGYSRVTLMCEATPPHRADANVRLPITIGAGVASLLLALFFVVWLNAGRGGKLSS